MKVFCRICGHVYRHRGSWSLECPNPDCKAGLIDQADYSEKEYKSWYVGVGRHLKEVPEIKKDRFVLS